MVNMTGSAMNLSVDRRKSSSNYSGMDIRVPEVEKLFPMLFLERNHLLENCL